MGAQQQHFLANHVALVIDEASQLRRTTTPTAGVLVADLGRGIAHRDKVVSFFSKPVVES